MAHAARVAAYWYGTAIVLVASALLRLFSRPMAVPVWVPAAELGVGVLVGVLGWRIATRVAPYQRLLALASGGLILAGAVAMYVLGIGYEFGAFIAAVAIVVTAGSASAFTAHRQPAVPAVAGWQPGYPQPPQPGYIPGVPAGSPYQGTAPGWPPQPTVPPSPAPTLEQPAAAPRARYASSRGSADEHALEQRPRRRARHAAEGPTSPATPAAEPEQGADGTAGAGTTPDEHPDVQVAPRRRRHARPEPGQPPDTP